jgi:hypothetical protein
MTAAQRTLLIIVHAPALKNHDDRPTAVVHAMERTLPGLRLGWTMSEKGDIIALPRRDEWVAGNTTNGGFPFLCNDDDNHLVTVAGLENPNGLAAGSPPHLEVHADLPLVPRHRDFEGLTWDRLSAGPGVVPERPAARCFGPGLRCVG